MKSLGISFLLLFSSPLIGKDELVTIQAVSENKKTFIIRKGAIDGVVAGRQSLFSSDKFTLVASPIETTREHSHWKLADPRGIVPFEKGDIVAYTNAIYNLSMEIPVLKHDAEYRSRLKREWNKAHSFLGKYIFRAAASFALNETITDVSPEKNIQRSGMHYEGFYVFDFHEAANFALGLRYDREISDHEIPSFGAETNHYFALGEFLFHVDLLSRYFVGQPRTIYMGIGGGLGISQSRISTTDATGYGVLFPTVRMGYQKLLNKDYALLFEGIVEHIRTNEKLSGLQNQASSILNVKFAIGLKF